jgi:hypothetical protein
LPLVGLETPVAVDVPIQEVLDAAIAFGLELVAQAESHHVLAVDGINTIVIRIFNGQEPQSRQLIIELWEVGWAGVGFGHVNVIDGGLNNVPQTIDLQQVIFCCRPKAGSFERKLGPGVEDSAGGFIGRPALAGRGAVIGKAAADTGRKVQPAEKCFWQD